MILLITGGAGFAGRHLIEELLKTGPRNLRILCAPGEKAHDLAQRGFDIRMADIRRADEVASTITAEIQAVFHLVGMLTETRKLKFKDIHVQGTRNVVDACKDKGVRRIVFTSIVGAAKDAPSANHRSKWESEEIIRASSLDHTIFRPAVIFGDGDRFTTMFAREIKKYPVVPIPGHGFNRIAPVFVNDLAKAMAQCLNMPETINKTYEVTGPEDLTFNSMVDCIDEVLGKRRLKLHIPVPVLKILALLSEMFLEKPRLTLDVVTMLQMNYTTSDNALQKVFGIKPTPFIEGMRTYLK